MERYAIRATESMYCGLHGIVDAAVSYESSVEEAYDTGMIMAADLFNQYISLAEDIEEIYEDDSLTEEEKEDEVQCYINERSQVEVYRIKAECTLSDEEINEALYQDFNEFVKTWCEDEDLV